MGRMKRGMESRRERKKSGKVVKGKERRSANKNDG